ncbi:MAG: peptidylprolyl isomerase, partial [Longimicrobiales bacterium]
PGAADRGGRLQPGRRGSWVSGFWEAANGLEEGEHTGVVRTEYGYHVIQLEERRTVPFEEVRSDVVLQAGTMLGGTDEAWTRWSDSVSASIRPDTAAVRRAVESGFLDLGSLALASGGERVGPREEGSAGEATTAEAVSEDARLVIARAGAGEGYRLDAFQRHLASLPKDRWAVVTEGLATGSDADPDADLDAGPGGDSGPEGGSFGPLLAEARREAVRHRALAEASRRGLGVSEGPRERTAREWRDQVDAWAIALGFEAGSASSAVAARALEALSTSRQNASIARRELESREPLLRAAYEVREAGS